jgi:hypothetical protein
MTAPRDEAMANLRAVLAEVLHTGWPGVAIADCVRIADSVVADVATGHPDSTEIVSAVCRDYREWLIRKGTP